MFSIRTLAALVATSSLVAGQIALPATVFDGSGGPLTAGNVYTRAGNLSVPAGETLTIEPGVIVKMNGRFIVQGALQADGTAEQPLIFTSPADDSAGGDTNNDGASAGSPGQWSGFDFLNGASGSLSHAELRFGGAGGFSNLYFSGADTPIALDNVLSRDGSFHGIDFNNHASSATVTDCRFENNTRWAMDEVNINTVPGFSGNTATGNLFGDSVNVTSTTLNASTALGPDNGLGDTLILRTNPTVGAGLSLSLGAGLILKHDGRFVVGGDLQVTGTEFAPVIFTSDNDDSVGGDSNGDGASTTGEPGQWSGLDFLNGSTGSVSHAEVRFGGAGGFSNLYFSGAGTPIALDNVLSRDGSFHGIDFNNHASPATVTDCRFENNTRWAMEEVNLNTVPGFSGNSATGNLFGDSVNVTSTTLNASAALGPDNGLGDTLILRTNPSVGAGLALALDAGLILKFDGRFIVAGDLQVTGTEFAPVIFTSDNDDSVGGDSNGDGAATTGAPGQWSGFDFINGSSGSLSHAEVRFGGAGGFSNLYFSGADTPIALDNVLSRDGSFHGVDFNSFATTATVTNCRFEDNADVAMEQANINSVPGFAGNTASGNGQGDVVLVSVGTVVGDVSIGPDNGLAGTLYFNTAATVPDGAALHVAAGTILKQSGRLIVSGTLEMAGTLKQPVVLTSKQDDTFGGDSNADGALTSGAPGQHSGIEINTTASGVLLQNLLVRFGGAGGWANLWCRSDDTFMDQVRVESSSNDGFHVESDITGDELVAYDCTTGFEFTSGSATVTRSTAAGNGVGMLGGAAFTGFVASTLSGDNTTDWSGFVNAAVSFSAGVGVPAGASNVDAAPSFEDVVNGNLRLAQGSVGIDAGDPVDFLTLTGQDQSGYGRLMDGDLDGNKRVDMGAYEFNNFTLSVTGDATPGGSLDIDLAMTAPFEQTFMFFGLAPYEYNVGRYGSLFVNLFEPNVIMIWPLPPKKVTLDIPLDAPVPTDIYLQAGGRLMRVGSAAGNLSNPVCVTVE